MLEKVYFVLLKLLSEENYITSDKLADELQIGMRTVRKRIKDLNDILKDCGACIEAKPRYGYRLIIQERDRFQDFLKEDQTDPMQEKIPVNNEERVLYLLAYLLNQEKYVKSEMLMEFLCISKGTLSGTIKQVERNIERYGITLERRPNYGIRIKGSEFDIRRCMGDLFVHRGFFQEIIDQRQRNELSELAKMTMDSANRYGIRFSETVFERFVNDIYIQIRRVRSRHFIDISLQDLKGLSKTEMAFVEDLRQRLVKKYDMDYPQNEKMYIALHLAGKRMVGCQSGNELNFVIQENIDKLAVDMLETVYEQTGIDLRGNFELRMSLNQHLVPMDIRIRYDMPLTNTTLKEIKEKYLMGYNVAVQAAGVLKEHYQKQISEDEIGYLALIFALALEQAEITTDMNKSRILIVCNSGKGISRLLMYRFQQVFSSYIHEIYVSNLIELETFDFRKVDYVFTTVPITRRIPVPIQEVGLFLEEKDLRNVRKVLESGCKGYLLNAYRREHFFVSVKGTTREEVLDGMCQRIQELDGGRAGLYESVMERELLCSTDFGNLVAIPHPNKIMDEESSIYVAVLDQPILWNRHPVQVVMLMVMGRMEGRELQDFYEMTTRFIADKEAIKRLIEERNYETLMEGLMKQIGV